MLNRPGISIGCQKRICGYTTGTKAGTILDGLKPPWQAVTTNGSTYYFNPDTNVTQWEKPENIASGHDFFEMRNFCADTCINLVGNELPTTQSRSGSMQDALGEVLQVPDKLSNNPWMPPNNIFNQLPDITEDDCLNINAANGWKPTKGYWFNVYGTPEEECAEDPNNIGQGISRQKKFIGLTENKKACRVEFRKTDSSCDRECHVRFLKTEARASGQHHRYKSRIATLEELWQKAQGNLNGFEESFADLIETDLRKTWEIGRKKGVKWGIDERPGIGHINQDVDGHYITYQNLDAPYGYKIWAEYVKIEAPKLGNGKCPIDESGWYRTAKIPITKNESRNMDNLKNEYNFGSRMKVKLGNEDEPDQVLIVDNAESGYLTEVFSKTTRAYRGYPAGKRNWKWDGPLSLG
jgi:hypothetical protein